MLTQLLDALVESKNEAADDVLLEALRLGTEAEKSLSLGALLRRRTVHGLAGVVRQYLALPSGIQLTVLQNIRHFHGALRECGKSRQSDAALGAVKLIALGKQGKLTYILSEALHGGDEAVSKAAVEALVALARWANTEARRLTRTLIDPEQLASEDPNTDVFHAMRTYRQLMDERPEIEQAITRALDVHRGKFGQELLRAALLLADWPGSKTLSVLHTAKHGGQTAVVRRLQQPPESEHVEAFLLGATHGGLRSHFGVVLSHIAEPPVLDALLRRTHWLKDHQLQLCMHQVGRGVWWNENDLARDLARRENDDAARIAEWIAVSGIHDVVQDERLEKVRTQVSKDFAARLRLMRIAMRRPRGTSISLLRGFLSDPDERLVRLAAREIVRRRPPEFDNILIQLMTSAPESVRRVISRSISQVGFDQFWQRFDRLDRATRRTAGRAMLKVLPDAVQRLERKMRAGPIDQRIKGVQMAQELGVADQVATVLLQLSNDPNARLRSKAVGVLAETSSVPTEPILEKALHDNDGRVRANAIEVLEAKRKTEFIPLLTERARSNASNRERANAIKALHRMKVGTATTQLTSMLRDDRAEHRISALWALGQIGWWQMINEVGRLAKDDPHLRVRRYAMTVLRGIADRMAEKKRKAG